MDVIYDVIYLKAELKSYTYNDGLYAIVRTEDNIVSLQKIVDGKLAYYDDNNPWIICTGINNKGIKRTDLKIKK
jgi:hypothetical protein